LGQKKGGGECNGVEKREREARLAGKIYSASLRQSRTHLGEGMAENDTASDQLHSRGRAHVEETRSVQDRTKEKTERGGSPFWKRAGNRPGPLGSIPLSKGV